MDQSTREAEISRLRLDLVQFRRLAERASAAWKDLWHTRAKELEAKIADLEEAQS